MINKVILDAGIATTATAGAQIAANQPTDWTPIIVGVLAPIVKEALFKLIDKIGTIRKNRKEKKA